MSGISFSSGQEFFMGNRNYVLRDQFDDEWQMEDMQTHRIICIKTKDLLKAYVVGQISFKQKFTSLNSLEVENNKTAVFMDNLNESDINNLKVKKTFVIFHRKNFNGIRSMSIIEKALKQYWNVNNMGPMPSASTAYKWIKRFNESDDNIESLIIQNYKKGNRVERLDKDASDFCNKAINEFYMQSTRPTIQGTLFRAIQLISNENKNRPKDMYLKLPSYSYIRKKIEGLNKYTIDKARHGKQYADLHYRTSIGTTPTNGPLSRVEIDHTPLDIDVIDDEHGEIIGKPTLTTLIDCDTKCIAGAHLSFESNSYSRVVAALKHAIFPKIDLKEKYPSIKNEWECFGLMTMIASDRGAEFIGNNLESLCLSLGIELNIMPARRGDNKGSIERLQKTINEMVTNNSPGKTFSSTHVRGNGINTREKACIKISTMKEILFKSIVDIYHQKNHRSIGMSPAEKWRQSIKVEEIYLPISTDFFDSHSGEVAERKLTHTGIEINSLIYNSVELGIIRKEIGSTNVRIRWNQEDLGYIFVILEKGGTLKVPVIPKYQHYALGKSKSQLKVVKRYLDANQISASAEELANAHDEISQLIERDRKASKQKTRVRVQRFIKNQIKEDVDLPKTSSKKLKTEIENITSQAYQYDDIPDFESI